MRARVLFLSCLLAAAAAAGLWLGVAGLPAGDGPAPRSLEERVRQYLIAHPEVLNEAADAFQRRRERERAAETLKLLTALKDQVRSAGDLPVLGNPEGDVTVVEFFDYRCPYCKRTLEELRRLVGGDPKLRLVFKEFPILGPDSLIASRAAVASRKQGKYVALHIALMSHRGALDAETVMGIAKEAGLDTARPRADMEDGEVSEILKETQALAARLGIEATPTLIIGDDVHAGYADLDTLKRLVARARAGCKSC